ncbi:hypothetical protein [Acinetobacter gerneri]|uniref:hypothetical protein n=1 Tax=Acinetobacter gerneri TaxID=202952 RepID=UPI0032139BBC
MELFKGIAKDKTNADIGWMNSKASAYEYGYLRAAQILSINYENHHTIDKDSLIFPIIFLYRQHIELSLKSIIRNLYIKLQVKKHDQLLGKHKLLLLWDKTIELYSEYVNKKKPTLLFTNQNFKEERKIISEFNLIDEDSFSFRYSTDKKGNELLNDISYISLNNFQLKISIVIKTIENIFNTILHDEN